MYSRNKAKIKIVLLSVQYFCTKERHYTTLMFREFGIYWTLLMFVADLILDQFTD